MTLAHMTLDDLGGALSWRALLHFAGGLGTSSRLACELCPEVAESALWLDGTMVAPLLATLVDCVNWGRWEYLVSCVPKGGRKPRRPAPVTRPWDTKAGKGRRRVGRDPIPIRDFDAWWDSAGKRRE